MAFARWDPVRDLLAIQQRLDRFAPGPSGWTPPVDLLETPDQYVITAEVPGLTTGDIDVRADGDRLTIAGSRRELPQTCEQYHCVERGHGSFRRTFQLPQPIDGTRITADLRDGVLTVTCPKLVDPARRIHIS